MKIIKTVTTRCQIFRLKCRKIDFGWGSSPDPTGRAYSAPRPPSWNKGDLLLRKRKGHRKGKGRRGKVREGREENGRKRRGE